MAQVSWTSSIRFNYCTKLYQKYQYLVHELEIYYLNHLSLKCILKKSNAIYSAFGGTSLIRPNRKKCLIWEYVFKNAQF
jgi:hypothetical protein